MSILGFLVLIVVLGVLLWLVNTYIPMDANIKKILNVVVIIFIVIIAIWFLLGFVGGVDTSFFTRRR